MPLVLSCLLAAAVDAPITQVTVFAEEARAVRTAHLSLNGEQAIDFPTIPEATDANSIRVESTSALVRHVDVERVVAAQPQPGEAAAASEQIASLEAQVMRFKVERGALSEMSSVLAGLQPNLSPEQLRSPAPLNPTGWAVSAQFVTERLSAIQERIRELDRELATLAGRKTDLEALVTNLRSVPTRGGWRVTARVAGSGAATVTLSYLTKHATWTPSWDLRLQPKAGRVMLGLAGVVKQQTGEDWANAQLTLSTAIPSTAVAVPALKAWRIGTRDRFMPRSTPVGGRMDALVTVDGQTDDGEAGNETYGYGFSGSASPEHLHVIDVGRTVSGTNVRSFEGLASAAPAPFSSPDWHPPAQRLVPVAIATPQAWLPHVPRADSPIALAGSYDLSFASMHAESIPSGDGLRRIPLWSAQWPVAVERTVYPAVTSQVFLVAELRNPSAQVLPGGPAALHVGADPAGTARLSLVSPGESFTLPLGVDRAIQPVRTVELVEKTHGVFSKDDVGTYTVSIELSNPYRIPIQMHVIDQWPLSTQKEVQTELLRASQGALPDAEHGQLEWRITVEAQQKSTLSFTYTIKRPKDWLLGQAEVSR